MEVEVVLSVIVPDFTVNVELVTSSVVSVVTVFVTLIVLTAGIIIVVVVVVEVVVDEIDEMVNVPVVVRIVIVEIEVTVVPLPVIGPEDEVMICALVWHKNPRRLLHPSKPLSILLAT